MMSGTQMGTIVFSVLFAIVVIVIIALIVRSKKKKQSPSADPPSSAKSGPSPSPRAGTGMTPEGPALCAGCGHQNPADNNFCEQCGEKLG